MRTREELRNVVGAGAISCTGRKVRRNASDFTRAWGIVNQEWKLDPRAPRPRGEGARVRPSGGRPCALAHALQSDVHPGQLEHVAGLHGCHRSGLPPRPRSDSHAPTPRRCPGKNGVSAGQCRGV